MSLESMSLGQLIIIWIVAIWIITTLFNHFVKPLPVIIVKLPFQMARWLKNTLGAKRLKAPPLSSIHGSARFAKAEEYIDLSKDNGGIPLGYRIEQDKNGDLITPRLQSDDHTLCPYYLYYSGEQHLITIAPARTGKGACAIIPTLLSYNASILVIDPKGQAAAVTARRRGEMGQEVYFINPFSLHDLPDSGFNPLAGLDPQAPNFAAAVAGVAEVLILHDGGSTHWTDSARDLVECLIMWECITAENPTLPNALIPLGWGLDKFRERMKDINAHDYRPMAHLAGRFTSDEHKDAAGIVSTAVTQTKIFLEPLTAASLSRQSFNWIDLKRRGVTVYLIPPVDSLGSHGRWLRLMVASALSGLYTPEKPAKPVLMILDEFAQLGRMASIESAAAVAAGHHVQIWPILQDLNQLEDLYGKRSESFMANMGIIQVFRPNDTKTAEYFSNKAGKSTVQTTSTSQGINSGTGGGFGKTSSGQSSGHSYAETGKPLFFAQDLMGMANNQQIIFKYGLQYPILAGRVAYYENPALAGRFDPDPFHPGGNAAGPSGEVWVGDLEAAAGGWRLKRVLPTVALWLVVVAGLAVAGWWFSPYASAPTESAEAKKNLETPVSPKVVQLQAEVAALQRELADPYGHRDFSGIVDASGQLKDPSLWPATIAHTLGRLTTSSWPDAKTPPDYKEVWILSLSKPGGGYAQRWCASRIAAVLYGSVLHAKSIQPL
jgi:type IV secretion system protein VirD4